MKTAWTSKLLPSSMIFPHSKCFSILCIAGLVIISVITLHLTTTKPCSIHCDKMPRWRWGFGDENGYDVKQQQEEVEAGQLLARNFWATIAAGSPRVYHRCKASSCSSSRRKSSGDNAGYVSSSNGSSEKGRNYSSYGVTCPDHFKWIERDLEPWKKSKISRSLLKRARQDSAFESSFRVVLKGGKVYAGGIGNCYQTRAIFSLWGLLQLTTFYRGLVPDVELVFGCGDKPAVWKKPPPGPHSVNASFVESTVPDVPPPVFRYCTTPQHFDIPFPDWSFWGWPEVNIQPWEIERQSIEEGASKTQWKKRLPKAFWKGNIYMGEGTRMELTKCNTDVAEILSQNWGKEERNGYKNSRLSSQCKHRYKVYVEGIGWSVSLKYILACDSPVLLVTPKYLDFFTRGLLPRRHFLSIPPSDLCPTIASAVHWGNDHMIEAMELGKMGSEFAKKEISMTHVYDYMLHILREYAKLQDFKPKVGSDLIELCPEAFLCATPPNERPFLEASMVHAPSQSSPCILSNVDTSFV